MQKIAENIIQSRAGGKVERCHNIPHNGSYSNASHQWGVAMLMFYLYPKDFPKLSIYCLTHDIGEAWVGDIPAPVKWAIPEMGKHIGQLEEELLFGLDIPRASELTEAEQFKLKSCDKLELYLWCLDQQRLGNQFADDCRKALDKHFVENPLEVKAMAALVRILQIGILPKQQGVAKECLKTLQN